MSVTISQSYLKVPYDLRLKKQIERRMLIDSFIQLLQAGFNLRDYKYIGFGSIYFFDYVLLRKYFGIQDMQSVEHDESIQKRIAFNKPYGDIDTYIGPVSDVISTLDRERQHILWLDYDCRLEESIVHDVVNAAGNLSVGSILLVTVDVEAPIGKEGAKSYKEYYEREAGPYIGASENFSLSQLPGLNARIMHSAIQEGLAARNGVEFQMLYNFLYEDGHKMLTFGGMIGDRTVARKIHSFNFSSTPYFRSSMTEPPFFINPPNVTRKERTHIDAHLPCAAGWEPEEFELDAERVKAYQEVYKYYPIYAESVV